MADNYDADDIRDAINDLRRAIGGVSTESQRFKSEIGLEADALRKNTSAQDADTEALRRHSRQLDVASDLGFWTRSKLAVGELTGGLKTMGKQLQKNEDSFAVASSGIDAFAKSANSMLAWIPGATASIENLKLAADMVVTEMNDSLNTFQELSKVGGNTAEGIDNLRQIVPDTLLSLQKFGGVVSSNSAMLAQYGGTTAEGTEAFAEVQTRLANFDEGLRNLGYTVDDMAEGTAAYIALQAKSGKAQKMTADELTQGTAQYLRELDELSRITGQSRKELMSHQQQIQSEARWRAHVNKLERTGQADVLGEERKVETAVSAKSPVIAQGIRDILGSGGALVTEESRKAFMVLPEIQTWLKDLSEGRMTSDELLKKIGATAEKQKDSLEGLAGVIGDQSPYAPYAQIADLATVGKGIDEAAQQSADAENKASETTRDLTQAQKNTQQASAELHKTLSKGFPVMGEALNQSTDALKKLTTAVEDLTSNLGGGSVIKDAIETAGSTVGGWIEKGGEMASSALGAITGGAEGPQTVAGAKSLGETVAKYESGGKGTNTVGYDTLGGTSYGKYQIAAKTGTFSSFLKFLEKTDPAAAQELRNAGSANTGSAKGASVDAWKKLAGEGRLQQAEHDFIKQKHYDPAINKAKQLGYDVNDPRVQEMVWSGSIQHGKVGKVLEMGAGGKTPEEQVKRFYEARRHYVKGNKYEQALLDRYSREEKDVLGMSTAMPNPQNAGKQAMTAAGFSPGPQTATSGGGQSVVDIAKSHLGQGEATAGKSKAELSPWLNKYAGNKSDVDLVPWCARFVSASLEQAGIKSTKSASAASYKNWGQGVDAKDARSGDVVLVPRKGGSGYHVMISQGIDQATGKLKTIGGNQGKGDVSERMYDLNKQGMIVRRANELMKNAGSPEKAAGRLQERSGRADRAEELKQKGKDAAAAKGAMAPEMVGPPTPDYAQPTSPEFAGPQTVAGPEEAPTPDAPSSAGGITAGTVSVTGGVVNVSGQQAKGEEKKEGQESGAPAAEDLNKIPEGFGATPAMPQTQITAPAPMAPQDKMVSGMKTVIGGIGDIISAPFEGIKNATATFAEKVGNVVTAPPPPQTKAFDTMPPVGLPGTTDIVGNEAVVTARRKLEPSVPAPTVAPTGGPMTVTETLSNLGINPFGGGIANAGIGSDAAAVNRAHGFGITSTEKTGFGAAVPGMPNLGQILGNVAGNAIGGPMGDIARAGIGGVLGGNPGYGIAGIGQVLGGMAGSAMGGPMGGMIGSVITGMGRGLGGIANAGIGSDAAAVNRAHGPATGITSVQNTGFGAAVPGMPNLGQILGNVAGNAIGGPMGGIARAGIGGVLGGNPGYGIAGVGQVLGGMAGSAMGGPMGGMIGSVITGMGRGLGGIANAGIGSDAAAVNRAHGPATGITSVQNTGFGAAVPGMPNLGQILGNVAGNAIGGPMGGIARAGIGGVLGGNPGYGIAGIGQVLGGMAGSAMGGPMGGMLGSVITGMGRGLGGMTTPASPNLAAPEPAVASLEATAPQAQKAEEPTGGAASSDSGDMSALVSLMSEQISQLGSLNGLMRKQNSTSEQILKAQK